MKKLYTLLFLLLSFVCYSQEMNQLFLDGFQEGIRVDLREPSYSDGVLTTSEGGVITGPHLRIQALNIRYTKKVVEGTPFYTIEAEGQLIVEFGDYIFIGKKLFYDFDKKEGVIDEARTESGPWFLVGEQFYLRSDGSYLIQNGYVTTSEKEQPDWGIYSDEVIMEPGNVLNAKKVQFRVDRFNILWVPSLKANLTSLFDSPLRYRFRWGGRQGPRLGITYEIFSTDTWKTFLRFDYRLTRGPGLGFETKYKSRDGLTEFQSINYIAKDSSLIKPKEKIRYRYEGVFRKSIYDNRLSFLLTYDKISDLDMPSNYYDWDFDIDKSRRTQFLIRQQEEKWISTLYTRLRVNNFQTVKQELPTYSLYLKPFEIAHSGIMFDNKANLSFLDFKYSSDVDHVHNYASSRIEYAPLLYRSIKAGPLTFTPEVGGVAVFYGDTPRKGSQWMTLGIAGCELQTQLYRYYQNYKHVIEPYAHYHFYSTPSLSPHHHYIFDISDGWTHLNQVTFGVSNSFYSKKCDNEIARLLFVNLYSNAFFESEHLHPTVPKIYTDFIISLIPTLTYTINTAWDLRNEQVDHFNFRTDWTLNDDLAVSAEFRHRDNYSWRKVDQNNFFLEAYRSQESLRHSSLSDRRDTFLLHLFYRFHPTWAFEFTSRQGWNRLRQPRYLEYEIDLLTTIQTAWNLKLPSNTKKTTTVSPSTSTWAKSRTNSLERLSG